MAAYPPPDEIELLANRDPNCLEITQLHQLLPKQGCLPKTNADSANGSCHKSASTRINYIANHPFIVRNQASKKSGAKAHLLFVDF